MSDPTPARILEAQLALAEVLMPILIGGALAVVVLTLACLWELCLQSRQRDDRQA
jgi:hypothetical protein